MEKIIMFDKDYVYMVIKTVENGIANYDFIKSVPIPTWADRNEMEWTIAEKFGW